MKDCIFCKIVAGEISSTKVYEDEATLAFLSIQPDAPGHMIVIPKKHSRNIFDIEDTSAEAVIRTVKKVAKTLREVLGAGGVNIVMNNEPVGGQVIFHSHIHVIPRHKDDGLNYGFHHTEASPEDLEPIAAKLRTHLA